jgi:hypothetical protein
MRLAAGMSFGRTNEVFVLPKRAGSPDATASEIQ